MRARTAAEAPQLLSGALVLMHELVELEGVDLAGVIPHQTITNMSDERCKLGLM